MYDGFGRELARYGEGEENHRESGGGRNSWGWMVKGGGEICLLPALQKNDLATGLMELFH